MTSEKLSQWLENNISTEESWIEFGKFMENKYIIVKNFEILCLFVISLLGASASIKRLFSHINKHWSSEKSQLNISTLKSVMLVYTNFNETCNEMFKTLKSNNTILKAIHGSVKYVNNK